MLTSALLVTRSGHAAAAQPCAPDPGPCVVVTVYGASGPTSSTVIATDDILGSDAQFPPDVIDAQYHTRDTAGGSKSPDPLVAQGVSIRQIVQHLDPPVAPSSVTYTEIIGRTDYRSALTSDTHDFDDPNNPDYPFEDGLEPAIYPIVGPSDAMGYIRPLRAGTDSDVNVRDYLQTLPGGALLLNIHTSGSRLTPTITAAPHQITAGDSVAFDGNVVDPDGTPSWTWTFGDGAISDPQGPQASHVYSTPGTYLAFADVADSAGSSGESMAVQITVTPAASSSSSPTPTPRSSASTSPTPTPTGHSHGGGSSHNPSNGPTSGDGHHGGGAPQSSIANSTQPGRSTAASESSPGAPTLAGPPVANPSLGSPTAATASATSAAPVRGIHAADGLVSGYLINGLVAMPLSGPTNSPLPRRPLTAPAARNGVPPPWRVAVWLVVGVGILGLLILGAAGEARRPARRTKRHRE
jgi:hypothetical protein